MKEETMKEIMDKELQEAIDTLKRANSAFERLFGEQKEEAGEGE